MLRLERRKLCATWGMKLKNKNKIGRLSFLFILLLIFFHQAFTPKYEKCIFLLSCQALVLLVQFPGIPSSHLNLIGCWPIFSVLFFCSQLLLPCRSCRIINFFFPVGIVVLASSGFAHANWFEKMSRSVVLCVDT